MTNLVFYRDDKDRVCFEPPTETAQPRFALKLDSRGSILSSTLDAMNGRHFIDETINKCEAYYAEKYAREDAEAKYASVGEPRGFRGYGAK